MEFGNIGKHCSFSLCHQQDFLPFECDGCKKIYCTDHARADDHQCSLPSDYDSIYVIICPICEQRIKMKNKEDPNEVWYQHSLSGQCQPKKNGPSQIPNKKCMANKCYVRLNTINQVTCQQCFKEVCLKHRFEDDHQCTQIVRNQQTQKSKLLQPGYIQSQQHSSDKSSQPIMSSSQYKQLDSDIKKFGSAPSQQSKPAMLDQEKYTPERCEFCGSLFRDINELIKHAESHFKDTQKQTKTETEKCPHCPQRFAITELINHLQQDHFIF